MIGDVVRRGLRWWAMVLVPLMALASCGGGDDVADESNASDGESLADAVRIDDGVDARTGAATEFAAVSDPLPVAVGDTVRTDATGFAEVAYFDGSVARLDVETSFDVIELTDDPGGSVVRTRMGLGRTWHRVRGLVGEDVYVVETAVATATVRGTAFVIVCPDETSCTFAVYEGRVEVDPLGSLPAQTVGVGEQLTVTADDGIDGPAAAEELGGSDWLVRNAELDSDVGFEALEPAGGDDEGAAPDEDCRRLDDGSVTVGAGIEALDVDEEPVSVLALDEVTLFEVVCDTHTRIVAGDDALAIVDDLMAELASSVPEVERTAMLGGPPLRSDLYGYRPSPGVNCDIVAAVYSLVRTVERADRGPVAQDSHFAGVSYICDGPP